MRRARRSAQQSAYGRVDRDGRLILRTPTDPRFRERLKGIAPPDFRTWRESTREWEIHPPLVERVLALVAERWPLAEIIREAQR